MKPGNIPSMTLSNFCIVTFALARESIKEFRECETDRARWFKEAWDDKRRAATSTSPNSLLLAKTNRCKFLKHR